MPPPRCDVCDGRMRPVDFIPVEEGGAVKVFQLWTCPRNCPGFRVIEPGKIDSDERERQRDAP